jgi:AraC-like DNA-binding protein
MRNLSLSVQFARAVLKNTVDHGLDPISLLRKNRISPRLLLEDDARISVERFADLQVSTMLAMQDESLGYAAQRLAIGSWSMMCHAVIGSATLGQALSRYCRFFALFESGFHPVLKPDAEMTRLELEEIDSGLPSGAYYSELFLCNSQRFCNWLVQEQLPLLGIGLKYPPVAREEEYRQVFMGNPVQFSQDVAALTFTSAQLEQPLKQNETSLRHFLRHPVLLMLTQQFASDSWTAQVRDLLRRNMEQLPELSEVARLLDIHPQTLRRRLAAEGTSFKDIKSRLRRDTALHFLGKQGVSIEEIAHRAGFSESSAFIRAFKGWTGVTPYGYRKGL